MSQHVQSVSRNFYENRTEQNFRKYFDVLKPIVYNVSLKILRNHQDAEDNVSIVFMKLFKSTSYSWKEKSHLAYVYTVAINSAKMLFNKGRITYNKGTEDEFTRKRFVNESELIPVDSEEAAENMMDYICYNQPDYVTQPMDIDQAYLHNSSEEQFGKAIEIIGNLDKDTQNEGTAQIIMDALCNDMAQANLRRLENVMDEKTRNKVLMENENLRKIIKHKGKRIRMISEKLKVDKQTVKEIIEIREMITKETKHYDKIARKYGLRVPDDMMTYEQIAKKHGLRTVGAIKTRVFRAKKLIREDLISQIRLMERIDGKVITGTERAYYDNGNLKHNIEFLKGQFHGKFITYYKNGNKKLEANYKNGILHGNYTEFYKNGVPKMEGEYDSGKTCGKWIGRNADSTVDSEYEYIGDATFFEHYDKQGIVEESGVI